MQEAFAVRTAWQLQAPTSNLRQQIKWRVVDFYVPAILLREFAEEKRIFQQCSHRVRTYVIVRVSGSFRQKAVEVAHIFQLGIFDTDFQCSWEQAVVGALDD